MVCQVSPHGSHFCPSEGRRVRCCCFLFKIISLNPKAPSFFLRILRMFSLSACLSDADFSKSLGDGFGFSTPASQKVNIVNVNVGLQLVKPVA